MFYCYAKKKENAINYATKLASETELELGNQLKIMKFAKNIGMLGELLRFSKELQDVYRNKYLIQGSFSEKNEDKQENIEFFAKKPIRSLQRSKSYTDAVLSLQKRESHVSRAKSCEKLNSFKSM